MVKIVERIIFRDDGTIENTTRKIEIPGKINGQKMLSAVMNLNGWNLVVKDQTNDIGMIIKGENESELISLKSLLEKTTISVAIQIPLNIQPPPTVADD